MCGQLTAYNTYATLSYTNPLFLGFSCYQNVNKEIGFCNSNVFMAFRKKYVTPRNFGSGVFFCVNGDIIIIYKRDYLIGVI